MTKNVKNQKNDVKKKLIATGLTDLMAKRLIDFANEEAEYMLKENPYSFIGRVKGYSFNTAEKVAANIGLESSGYKMEGWCMEQLMKHMLKGHSCISESELLLNLAKGAGADEAEAQDILDGLVAQHRLVRDVIEDIPFIYSPEAKKHEAYAAAKISELLICDKAPIFDSHENIIFFIREEMNLSLSDEQMQALLKAIDSSVFIITGGPGTGKTTIIKALTHVFTAQGLDVAVCAPTGRAAKRISESSGLKAFTIHRLLGADYDEEKQKTYFRRGESAQLEDDVIIVDEASMLNMEIFYRLLKAVPKESRLILVGDIDQLQPIGQGQVLADLLDSDELIEREELREIFRQQSGSSIIENAHLIKRGEQPDLGNKEGEFSFFEAKKDAEIWEIIEKEFEEVTSSNCDIKDIQIIAPFKKGDVGVGKLNEKIRNMVNPRAADKSEVAFMDRMFREGDRVMQTVNNYTKKCLTQIGDEELGVYNGELGIIIYIDNTEKTAVIEFDGGRQAEYDFDELAAVELAYAITIHKSQGSEFDTVIIPLSGRKIPFLSRNLIYTAVTRGKKKVKIIGKKRLASQMVADLTRQKRQTGLTARIRDEYDRRKI